MSCTIDHLRVDHRFTVLQEFTDAAGIRIAAGTQGILQQLEFDSSRREIKIALQLETGCRSLIFNLHAKDGPRIGRMRDYFEVGEPVEPPPARPVTPPVPAAPPPSTPPPKPPTTTPAKPRAASVAQPATVRPAPPNGTCLDQRTVACDCPTEFHRGLLPATHLTINACLHCGTVTATECLGDDGRFTGHAVWVYRTIALAPEVTTWLGYWPRVKENHTAGDSRWPMSAKLVRYPTVYYPATPLCPDLSELKAWEERLPVRLPGPEVARELRRLCHGIPAPPPRLPSELQGFADLWRALQLTPDADLSQLIPLAQLGNPANPIAVDLLQQRSDAFAVTAEALRSSDPVWRSAGVALARDTRPADPRLADVVIEILKGLSLDPLPDVPNRVVSCGRFETMLILIADLKLNTPAMQEVLSSLLHRLVRLDATLVDYIRIVQRELRGETGKFNESKGAVPWLTA